MFAPRTFFATVSVAVLLGGAAQAALSADQLWARWQEAAAAAGFSLSAVGQASDGGALTLTGVTVRPAIPMGADGLEGSIAKISMTAQADGSVTVEMAPEFTVPVAGLGDGIVLSQEGLVLTAREQGAGISYDYAADRVSLNMATASTVAQTYGPPVDVTGNVNMVVTGASGTYSDVPEASRVVSLTLNAANVAYSVRSSDAEATVKSDQITTIDDVVLSAVADVPLTARLTEIEGPGDVAALLKDGLKLNLEMAQGKTAGSADEVNPLMSFKLVTTGLPGTARVSVDQTGFALEVANQGATMSGTSEVLATPVNLSFGPIVMDVKVPLVGTDAQEFRYRVALQDVLVNEEIWALIDPGKTLPRDPASLTIDAAGMASLDLLMLAEASEAGMTEITPPRLDTLDIKALAFAVAGAAIDGSGSFTFDNATDTPVPVGTGTVTVTGVNGLIDRLVTIGLLPEDQAGSARMMMGMFLTPGEGEDVLTSTLESQAGGSVFVNGMQVK